MKSSLSPRRWPFWLIVAFVVYTLGGFFGAPWLMEKLATDRVAEAGRNLSVDRIRVNPYTLVIEVDGLELVDTDEVTLVSWDHYRWNFQASSLFRWAWTFKEIRLRGLYLNLERFSPDNQRFGSFLAAFEEDDAPPEPVPDEEPGIPRLLIHTLAVEDARLEWTDHLTQPVFNTLLGPISVEVHNLSTLPDDLGRQQVEIRNRAGGSLAWTGSVEFSPIRSEGDFSLRGQALDDLFEYANRFVPFEAHIGETAIDLHYEVHLDEQQEVVLDVSAVQGEFTDLEVRQANVEKPILSLPSIQVNNGGMRWPQQELELESIAVNGMELHSWLEPNGEVSLLSLVPESSAASEPQSTVDDAAPWKLELSRFSLDQSTIELQDRSLQAAPTFLLNGVSAQIDSINLEDGSRFPARLGLELASGGRVDFNGEVGVFPAFNAGGALELSAFSLSALQDYVAESLRVEIREGQLDLDGELMMDDAELLAYQGAVQLSSLDVLDGVREEKLLGLTGLEIDRAEISLSQNSANLSVIELNQPSGRIHIAEDLSTNIGDLVIESAAGEPAADESGSAGPVISVAGIEFEDGLLDFSDFSLPLPFEARISALDGTISALASESAEPAAVNLEGQVNEFGQARIEGTLSPWAPTQNTDIAMIFRNLEVARLTPYTVQFAGHTIAEGRMDLDLKYTLEDNQLEGANAIVIRELTLGEKVEHPDAVSLPLGLAVALLKDSEGVIDIDLPVSGDLNDPEFSYGGVIAKAIFNLITKVVTAPFRLLGNLVGIDSEDFGTLEFRPAEFEISPPDREKLLKLSEAMTLRPELVLEVGGVYSPELDRQALSQKQVEARIAEREQPGDEFSRKVIEALYTETFADADLAAMQAEFTPPVEEGSDEKPPFDQLAYVNELKRRMIEAEPVSDEQLNALADQRRDSVLAVLRGDREALPENVQAIAPEIVEEGEGSGVLMELKVSIKD